MQAASLVVLVGVRADIILERRLALLNGGLMGRARAAGPTDRNRMPRITMPDPARRGRGKADPTRNGR